MSKLNSFHAQHSPMGAYSSFTVGMFGAAGGMAMEKGEPANSAVFVGYKNASGVFHYLPLFNDIDISDRSKRFHQADEICPQSVIYSSSEISRVYRWATDVLETPEISFEISTPFFPIPDPDTASDKELQFASCPATFLKLTIQNTSKQEWEGFFGLENSSHWMALSSAKGFSSCGSMGFSTLDKVEEFCDFSVEKALAREHLNKKFMLGSVAGFSFKVPGGQSRTVNIVLGYYKGSQTTFNVSTRYWYTRYFSNLDDVFGYALKNLEQYQKETIKRDVELKSSSLSNTQQFLIAHATRSYYASTQWLDNNGKPMWIVNEGEYLMMNTLDLTVDMLFFELRMNPWTVRNVLEYFVDRYAYEDEIFSPDAPQKYFAGGISFTHDMGVANHFSPLAYSSYECGGLDRKCFSYMTCEQLTNWVLCACVYVVKTGDESFALKHAALLERCLESLLRRDHPDPDQRDGLMDFESSRTAGGGEITTYDSLDHSLGQARRNVYLGGKCWASYVALQCLFQRLENDTYSRKSELAALRCAQTLEQAFDEKRGYIPAVLDGKNKSAIIPAIEALVYPYEMGLHNAISEKGPYGGYIRNLKRHLQKILKPGVCLYQDGAWKLSSSADNSWMSKICLNQYVARHILGVEYEGEECADEAHLLWEVEGSKFYACSDQFSSGETIGSRTYPRIVTSILWLNEK